MGRDRGSNRYRYINGSAVRKEEPERQPRVYVDGKRVHDDLKTIKRRAQLETISPLSTIVFALASVLSLLLCIGYLRIQSDIMEVRGNISELKNQISVVKSQNDALNYSINSFVDTKIIYDKATKELGMQTAKHNQIHTYKSTDHGYTIQYGDIPKE